MRATSSLPVPDSPEMCTGAWLRDTRRIISRRRSIEGAWPMICVPVRADMPASEPCETRSAVDTMRRSAPSSSGLDTKSKAPSLSARTADSTFPCAVMTARAARPGRWAHPLQQVESVSIRKAHVRQAQIELLRLEQFLRAGDITRRFGGELHARERQRDEFDEVRLIIDNQDQRR